MSRVFCDTYIIKIEEFCKLMFIGVFFSVHFLPASAWKSFRYATARKCKHLLSPKERRSRTGEIWKFGTEAFAYFKATSEFSAYPHP